MRHFEERIQLFISSGEEYDAGLLRRTSFQRKKTTRETWTSKFDNEKSEKNVGPRWNVSSTDGARTIWYKGEAF